MTAGQVSEVADVFSALSTPVRIIQVDDGYQEHMGDWLVTAP